MSLFWIDFSKFFWLFFKIFQDFLIFKLILFLFYNVKKRQFGGDFTGPIPGVLKLSDELNSDLDANILDYLYEFGDLDKTTKKPVSATTEKVELQWLSKTNSKNHNKSAKLSINFLTGIAIFCCIASCLMTFLNAWFTHQSRNIV